MIAITSNPSTPSGMPGHLLFHARTVSTGVEISGGIVWASDGQPYIVRMDPFSGCMHYAVQPDSIRMEVIHD